MGPAFTTLALTVISRTAVIAFFIMQSSSWRDLTLRSLNLSLQFGPANSAPFYHAVPENNILTSTYLGSWEPSTIRSVAVAECGFRQGDRLPPVCLSGRGCDYAEPCTAFLDSST